MSLLLFAVFACRALPADVPVPPRPFVITVVDDQTGRGVPLVELKTVNEVRYVTDSAGVAALIEPGLIGQTVYFHVKSHGYEYPKDGFGYRGKALAVTEGGSATLRIKRVNVAERLYRVIGAGIYRDTVLAGGKPPIRHPLLNARVFGSDSVLNAVYQGKLHWFWGDTNRPEYPLGNFHTPGAVSDLPGQGGLDPAVGVDLTYFTAPNGFALETAHLPGSGPTWLGGLAVVPDESGQDRLVAGYAKIKPPMDTYEKGLVVFDPASHTFKKETTFPLDAPAHPTGHTYLARDGSTEYVYYTTPYPLMRVPARLDRLRDIKAYESFTCLATGSRLEKGKPPKIDRGPDGRARHAWRPDTPALGPGDEARLVREGHLKADEALLALQDVETGKPVLAHGGTVTWNEYRKRWVLIAVEVFGTSMLGEVWYAEADAPLGPWAYARKVVTHDKYTFYNPRQHPYFDQDGGRLIYFEGTYATTFSGNTDPTPRYEYNQVMYRLDLADPRLNLPAPVAGAASFHALRRPVEGTVPLYSVAEAGGGHRPTVGAPPEGSKAKAGPVAYLLPPTLKDPPKTVVAVYEEADAQGRPRLVAAEPGKPREGAKLVGHAWRAPVVAHPGP